MSETITIDFGPVIRSIERMGNQLGNEIDVQVGAVRNDLKTTQDDLLDLRERLEQYIAEDERRMAMQRAETKKGTLAAEIDRVFGHYRVVRRTSVGILQAVDVGNVQENTIQTLTEELMIQSPKYWLAPVIVTLAAWLRDDRETADRSLSAALQRDPAKTALFFSLILRRENRMEAASAWLRAYFLSLDPRKLNREFAVLLECVSSGAFGISGVDFILKQLREWNELLRDDEDIVIKEIATWQTAIRALADMPDLSHFKTLKQISPDWARIENMLRSTSGMCNFKAKMNDLAKKPVDKSHNMIDLLDDILELLVTEYDQEELPKRRELAVQQAIIDAEGDMNRVQDIHVMSQAALEENFHLLKMQDVCVFVPENIGVGVGTQKIAFGASHDIAQASLSEYTKAYRQAAVEKARLNFDENHSEYAKRFKYRGVQTDTAANQENTERQISDAWKNTFAPHITAAGEIRKGPATAVGVVCGIVGLFFIAAFVVVSIVIWLAAAAIVYYMVNAEKKKAIQRIADLEATCRQATQHSIQIYRNAIAEWTDVRLDYEDMDSEETELVQLIATWPSGRELLAGAE